MSVNDTPFVNGAARLSQRIATIRQRLAVGPMTNEIAALLLKRTQRRFDDEVDPNNQPWENLAPSTIAAKRRLGFGKQGKLKRTLNLRNSIAIVKQSIGAVYTNTGAGARIGIEESAAAVYGRYQNSGLGKRLPARRFLGVGALDIKAVDSFMRRRADTLMDE